MLIDGIKTNATRQKLVLSSAYKNVNNYS